MKWKAQVRINTKTGGVVYDREFPDGVCDWSDFYFSDEEWESLTDNRPADIDHCIWVKVEYDDGEPT